MWCGSPDTAKGIPPPRRQASSASAPWAAAWQPPCAVQARLGVTEAGERVERTPSRITAGLVQAGVWQLVVAGGETSGAVVQALGVT